MRLQNKTIALGITGGIAAYKACEIISLLKKEGAIVYAAMTKNACEFIAPLTLETLTGNKVMVDTFDRNFTHSVKHISLAQKADLFVVAPASANFIGKFANGIADDFLSTTVLATKAKVLVAPAMNSNMLSHAAVQANIDTLKVRGVEFVESEVGMLACGVVGSGRLSKPEKIVKRIVELLNPKTDFLDKTILVTAGATRANLDPVRYITNHSSGKMGTEIAKAATVRGAKVILVHANVDKKLLPNCYKSIAVETTADMKKAVLDSLKESDIIIKAAAPVDYEIKPAIQKIKSATLSLELKKASDIAAEVGKKKGDKKLIVFAAETADLIKNAKEKLKNKNADMVVANDVAKEGAGFLIDTNIVTLITKSKQTTYDKMPKSQVAEIILDAIGGL